MKIEKLYAGDYVSNCYLVFDEESKDAVIIDPGAAGAQIAKRVLDAGLTIEYIILTHSHPDHIGGVKDVKEATGAKVAIHADDVRGLQRMGGRPGPTGIPISPIPAPDLLLKEGDSLDAGSLHFSIIHTPGHTQGGICLLIKDVLFSGDTLFNASIGRWDMPGGDGEQLVKGIMEKLMILPDETLVLPGHGPETTIGKERKENPFLQGQGIP